MMTRLLQTVIVSVMLLTLVACAGGISSQARSQVTYSGAFSEVLENPFGFEGQTVMWGGRVIEIQNQGGLTEIVALQMVLDSKYRPSDGDASQGRFLIKTPEFMDPALYPPGTLFTVVGNLLGAENRMIGEMDYRYPVIDVVEIETFDPGQRSSPRIHIGIGVGGSF